MKHQQKQQKLLNNPNFLTLYVSNLIESHQFRQILICKTTLRNQEAETRNINLDANTEIKLS